MNNFFSSGRTPERQRGYVLIAAIALAILYFGLMELMLIESQRTLREAQRFRAKILATTLVENAAELAAEHLCQNWVVTIDYSNSEGKMEGKMERSPAPFGAKPARSPFKIKVTGTVNGVPPALENLSLNGNVVDDKTVEITYSHHSYDKEKDGP